ncbi:MAG: cysteine desulfurase [Bacteroidota bacterium]
MINTQLDIQKIRQDFPALHQEVHGKPLVYFDNAATSQKPQSVIDRLNSYYQKENSNVHRGVHKLSQEATDAYEEVRKKVQKLINASKDYEVIYTRGTTEGINLLASTYGRKFIGEGDEIIISAMEHHSNIVPWQMLCEEKGAILKVIPMSESGELDIHAYKKLLNERTKLVSVVYISNSLGTVNPVKEIISEAHKFGAAVMIDAAQVVPHDSLDVQDLDCEFLVFSSHKMFGPTGIGIFYGKEEYLNKMPPYMGGGDMIDLVSFDKTTYAGLPHKFEAGTPNIADTIALGAAIDYIEHIGYPAIAAYEQELLEYGMKRLGEIDGIRFIGTATKKASVISFLIGDIHPYDAGTILDRLGIAVRTGHHCTQPIMRQLDIPGTIRASFAFYNTFEEIDKLAEGIQQVKKMFG